MGVLVQMRERMLRLLYVHVPARFVAGLQMLACFAWGGLSFLQHIDV